MSAEKNSTYRKDLSALFNPSLISKQPKEIGINAGLWLDKYIRNQSKLDTSSRSELVKEVAELPIPQLYTQFYQQWERMLADYGVKSPQMRRAHTQGRMAIGLGDESVLETSIALHHTYGVPYIAGSALKGLAASYARRRLGDTWRKDTLAYKTIFGDTEEAGSIVFFDALPSLSANNKPECALYQDTITVHHPGYYQATKGVPAPSDWDSPTPIPFLSATGSYLIALAAPNLENAEQWIEKTFEILEYALKEMGIGAKTSSGYGRMVLDYLDEATRQLHAERKRRQNEEEQRLLAEERQKEEAERQRREAEQQRLEEERKRLAAEKLREEAEQQSVKNWKFEIERLVNVASDMDGYYKKWQALTSDENKVDLATAIIAKVRRSGIEKNMLKNKWYPEVVAYINNRKSIDD